MIIKILGILDILTGFLFWMYAFFGFGSGEIILLLGFILLVKGVVFIMGRDLVSIFDIIFGILIIASGGGAVFEIPKIVVLIVSLFLLQRGIFSLA